jgi:hypothetical protein
MFFEDFKLDSDFFFVCYRKLFGIFVLKFPSYFRNIRNFYVWLAAIVFVMV